MSQFYKILTTALTLAVAFLLYDRLLKPLGDRVIPKPAGATVARTIEQQLEEEGF